MKALSTQERVYVAVAGLALVVALVALLTAVKARADLATAIATKAISIAAQPK